MVPNKENDNYGTIKKTSFKLGRKNVQLEFSFENQKSSCHQEPIDFPPPPPQTFQMEIAL